MFLFFFLLLFFSMCDFKNVCVLYICMCSPPSCVTITVWRHFSFQCVFLRAYKRPWPALYQWLLWLICVLLLLPISAEGLSSTVFAFFTQILSVELPKYISLPLWTTPFHMPKVISISMKVGDHCCSPVICSKTVQAMCTVRTSVASPTSCCGHAWDRWGRGCLNINWSGSVPHRL